MVPFKRCNCNCVYCECGGRTPVSSERAPYVSAAILVEELSGFLNKSPVPDYITFAGSGEPTLNSELGDVIRFVKRSFPEIKTALLTNGTLLHLPEVREAILPCDLVLPSLDAVSEDILQKINRPHKDVQIDRIIDGLTEFSRQFNGQLWVEVFIVPGINDTDNELSRFKEVLTAVHPTRVQLNSLDRPGACEWVTTASPELLKRIAEYFRPLPVEIISRKAVNNKNAFPTPDNIDSTILHHLLRRPETIEGISLFCNTTINEVVPVMRQMVKENICRETDVDGRHFYSVVESTSSSPDHD